MFPLSCAHVHAHTSREVSTHKKFICAHKKKISSVLVRFIFFFKIHIVKIKLDGK